MEYGIVYLLTNPVMPGLVKIGMTTQEDSISALSAKVERLQSQITHRNRPGVI